MCGFEHVNFIIRPQPVVSGAAGVMERHSEVLCCQSHAICSEATAFLGPLTLSHIWPNLLLWAQASTPGIIIVATAKAVELRVADHFKESVPMLLVPTPQKNIAGAPSN